MLTFCLQRPRGVLHLLLVVQVQNAAADTVLTLRCLQRPPGVLQLLPEVGRLFGVSLGLSAGALQLPRQLDDAGAGIAELQGRAKTRSPLDTVTLPSALEAGRGKFC